MAQNGEEKKKGNEGGKDVERGEGVQVLASGAKIPVLKEHNFMSSLWPGVPYIRTDRALSREEVPRSWLPPRMRIAPAVEKKPEVAVKPVRLNLQKAIEIKKDAERFAKQPFTPAPPPPLIAIAPITLPPTIGAAQPDLAVAAANGSLSTFLCALNLPETTNAAPANAPPPASSVLSTLDSILAQAAPAARQ